MSLIDEPAILRPFNRREAISVTEAAEIAGRHERTVRRWCEEYDIGRRVPPSGPYLVSRVALAALLDGDGDALAAYLSGDRDGPEVRAYFERLELDDLLR